ncbi:MAG: helix-turn-helix domain-containing protein [Acidimicrobiia bacterium]|nr:helix-turn-helix domain-containing protein [Acidimicrobiia bacterium]
MAQFGSLIAEHRERLGLSSSRVAELVGRSPGAIRSWERGRSHPDDPVVVSSLAAVLGIDETELFVAAGMEPPRASAPFSLEETLSAIAPAASQRATEQVEIPGTPDDGVGRHTRSVEEEKLGGRESALDRLRTAVESVTESVGDSGRRRRRGSSATSRRQLIVSPPPTRVSSQSIRKRPFNSLSYMEDVEERWSYRVRTILTAAGVGALGLILIWAGSELLGAVGDVWDALTAGL